MTELDRAAICRRLAQAREEAGLIQPEVAEGLEPPVHWRTIQIWERGEKTKKGEHRWTVPFKRLGQIAELTGQTKEWLLHGETPIATDRLGSLEAKVDGIAVDLARGIGALDTRLERLEHRLLGEDDQQEEVAT